MTIKQYQKLSAAVATKIKSLGEDVSRVRSLTMRPTSIELNVRDPRHYKDHPIDFGKGAGNAVVKFDTISNPNNPNSAYRTLKPGSMSAYNSAENVNVDLADYRYDSSQFSKLIAAIRLDYWTVVK